jgi:adenylylsulfate reductase subunit A
MHLGDVVQIETDVAVIGGGTAGVNSAMAAAEMGLDVLVVDKANINRSGAIAGGIDHFVAYLETGEAWDTRETYLKYVGRVAKGAANLKIHEAVYCEELTAAIERIERIGVPLRNPGTGEFFRTQAMGQPGPYFINFNGKLLKPKMADEVRRLGCKVLNKVQVTKITASCALERKESRFPPYHYREDFKETDDENYCGLIVAKKGPEGEITTRFEAISYEGY